MTNEILIMEGNGSFRFSVLFLFPIVSPAQVGGSNVIPTPATNPDATTALPFVADRELSPVEKAALDAGTLAFKVVPFRKDPTLSPAQLTVQVRQLYADELATFNRTYIQTWLHAGLRRNA